MMKVMLLNGSANKNGNTFTALSEIADRHPLQIAPIADYRGGWIKEPEATDEEAKNEYTLIDR